MSSVVKALSLLHWRARTREDASSPRTRFVAYPQLSWEGSVKLSHVHCRVLDLSAAVRWFDQVWQVKPTVHNERMAWLRFGDFGVILDAAPSDIAARLGFDSEDCDVIYRDVVSRGAESIEAPQDRTWGYRVAYLKGPGELTVEIEQPLRPT